MPQRGIFAVMLRALRAEHHHRARIWGTTATMVAAAQHRKNAGIDLRGKHGAAAWEPKRLVCPGTTLHTGTYVFPRRIGIDE